MLRNKWGHDWDIQPQWDLEGPLPATLKFSQTGFLVRKDWRSHTPQLVGLRPSSSAWVQTEQAAEPTNSFEDPDQVGLHPTQSWSARTTALVLQMSRATG